LHPRSSRRPNSHCFGPAGPLSESFFCLRCMVSRHSSLFLWFPPSESVRLQSPPNAVPLQEPVFFYYESGRVHAIVSDVCITCDVWAGVWGCATLTEPTVVRGPPHSAPSARQTITPPRERISHPPNPTIRPPTPNTHRTPFFGWPRPTCDPLGWRPLSARGPRCRF